MHACCTTVGILKTCQVLPQKEFPDHMVVEVRRAASDLLAMLCFNFHYAHLKQCFRMPTPCFPWRVPALQGFGGRRHLH